MVKSKIHEILLLRPFDESKDKENPEAVYSPFRVYTLIGVIVLALIGFGWAVVEPKSDSSFVFIALAVSLKAIQVLIEWHLGLKAVAKNGLVLVMILTVAFVIFRSY